MPYSYEDYEDKSKTYGSLRRAIGSAEMRDYYTNNGNGSLGEKALCDAGCGTGTYLEAFGREFKTVVACDFSQGMLDEAEKLWSSLGSEKPPISFQKEDVCTLEGVKTDSFNAVCCNQVVHHLRPDNDFQDLKNACKSFARVLVQGGKVCINFSSPENQRHGMWWAELIPKAQAEWEKRSPTQEVMKAALEEAGFEDVRIEALKDIHMYDPELYNNPENFLDYDRFSRSDSTFNLVSEEEKLEAIAKVQKMKDDGTLQEWFKKREALRKEVGATVTVYATKK